MKVLILIIIIINYIRNYDLIRSRLIIEYKRHIKKKKKESLSNRKYQMDWKMDILDGGRLFIYILDREREREINIHINRTYTHTQKKTQHH